MSRTGVPALALALLAASCQSTPPPASPPPTPTPSPAPRTTPAPPPAAALVPAQPDAAPAASSRPYLSILKLAQSGASEDDLLARVRSENVRYDLTTPEILELRQAGVSEAVVGAMLRSGR